MLVAQDSRPNMVVVLVGDHASEAISAYGGYLKNYAKTPKTWRDSQFYNYWSAPYHFYFANEKPADLELYNLQNDKDQVHNLAEDKAYQNLVGKYKNVLAKWQKQTGDTIVDARKLLGVTKIPKGTKVDDVLSLK